MLDNFILERIGVLLPTALTDIEKTPYAKSNVSSQLDRLVLVLQLLLGTNLIFKALYFGEL